MIDDEPDAIEAEDEDEVEELPTSERRPHGRDQVLRLLSDAVRAALAEHDEEAAQVANDAIARLCGGRDVAG